MTVSYGTPLEVTSKTKIAKDRPLNVGEHIILEKNNVETFMPSEKHLLNHLLDEFHKQYEFTLNYAELTLTKAYQISAGGWATVTKYRYNLKIHATVCGASPVAPIAIAIICALIFGVAIASLVVGLIVYLVQTAKETVETVYEDIKEGVKDISETIFGEGLGEGLGKLAGGAVMGGFLIFIILLILFIMYIVYKKV